MARFNINTAPLTKIFETVRPVHLGTHIEHRTPDAKFMQSEALMYAEEMTSDNECPYCGEPDFEGHNCGKPRTIFAY